MDVIALPRLRRKLRRLFEFGVFWLVLFSGLFFWSLGVWSTINFLIRSK